MGFLYLYYYNKRKDNKDISQDDVKRQTRYTTQLVYIIDNTKTGFDINILGLHCPNCGSPMVIRKGKYGAFVACSNYPECKHIKKEEKEARKAEARAKK